LDTQARVKEQRQRQLDREKEVARALIVLYAGMWRKIRAQYLQLIDEINKTDTLLTGRIDDSRVVGLTLRLASNFSKEAAEKIAAGQKRAAESVYADQYHYLGRNPASVNMLPGNVIDKLVGKASDDGSLFQLLYKSVTDRFDVAHKAAIESLKRGEQTLTIIARLRNDLGMGLTDALTVSRTEVFRAYREATRELLLSNSETVGGWIWFATLDDSTCIACWTMHGTEHSLDETLDGHPNCRCVMVPIVVDVELDIRDGLELFQEASEQTQKAVLGPAAYEAWKSGEVDLIDFLGRSNSAQWGTMRYTRSLKSIRAGTGGQWRGQEAREG